MSFRDYYGCGRPPISFELFPPKTEKTWAELEARIPRLIDLGPDFITVTYGALGTTREGTLRLASKVKNEYGQEAAHHLTCVALNREHLDETLEEIRGHNIYSIVAIRGDIPQGETEFRFPQGGFDHANEMVEHVKRLYPDFSIAVAGYPEKHLEAPDFETDLLNLKRKVEAGADIVITQLFYDNDDFYRFVDRCRALGIAVPIVAGLMPILSTRQIVKITNMCGSRIPASLMEKLEAAGDDVEEIQKVGIEHTTKQSLNLLEQDVQGIHFYVLNQRFHIAEIMEGIRPTLERAPQRVG